MKTRIAAALIAVAALAGGVATIQGATDSPAPVVARGSSWS